MKERIRGIFESNIKLIEGIEKAVYYFKSQEYAKALGIIVDSMGEINTLVTGIIEEPEYFSGVAGDSVTVMIEGILAAKRDGDYVLFADLLELQLGKFISRIQDYIIQREPFPYSMENYEKNLICLEGMNEELYKRLRKPEEPKKLLDKGYSVEYSSSGLMTMSGMENGSKFYFHSNNHIRQEAFLLAKNWTSPLRKIYHIYGMGFGYHIEELMKLCPSSIIYVYESSFDILRLTCNFVDLQPILENDNIHLVFDETLEVIRQVDARLKEKRRDNIETEESLFVHYPSYRNLKEEKEFLNEYLPWITVLEECK